MHNRVLNLLGTFATAMATVGGIGVVGATTLGAAATVAHACPVPNARIRDIGPVPGGLRGQVTHWTVEVRGPDGRPLRNAVVNFSFRSDAHGPRRLAQMTTNSAGRAVLAFQIPTNTNQDNVYLIARTEGPHPVSVSQRVAIGRGR